MHLQDLPHLKLLTTHRDAMINHLVQRIGIEPGRAALMIDQLEVRLTRRIVKDYAHLSISGPLARRILNDALGFLAFAADHPGHGPAPMPDLGWHTFMTYSPEYSAFCDAIAGRYLHHFPSDVEDVATGAAECTCGTDDSVLDSGTDAASTVAAMRQTGLDVDIDLWVGETAHRFATVAD